MKKKFSLILSVMLVFICCIMINTKCVRAAEKDFVIGTHNLNDTDENSAKVNDELVLPEKGWKRYDDTNENIKYFGGKWSEQFSDSFYNGSAHFCHSTEDFVKFNFVGNKLRIIGTSCVNKPENMRIIIDEEEYNFSENMGNGCFSKIIVFEKIFEKNELHTVKIQSDDGNLNIEPEFMRIRDWNLDAIDINENGELKPYEENKDIKAESISLDKNSLELLEGKSKKIIASVKPYDAKNINIKWLSSNESIAKVDGNGNITAIKEGEATITAKVENTDLAATCKVNVTMSYEENENKSVLSISLVNGITKEYDVSMNEVGKFINWYEERAKGKGNALYCFNKKINPYESVKEYIAHDKIVSFEVKEYKVLEK